MINLIKLSLLIPFGILFCFLEKTSYGQQRLSGSVKELNTTKGISFALITIFDKNSNLVGFVYSDSLGRYTLQWDKKQDSVIVNVSGIGFNKKQQKISISSERLVYDFYLTKAPNELPPVTIKSTLKFKQNGDTITFNADAYKQIQQKNIGDLLKNIPGFHVGVDGNLSYNGNLISKVLLEYSDLFGDDYGKLINNISTNGIEKLEVIKKYQDKSSLSKSFKSSKEQVLNIKFKGHKFIRSFGTVTGGSDFKNNYEGKLDMVILSKKIKLVTLANSNSNGNLGSNLMDANQNKNSTTSKFSNSIQSLEDDKYATLLNPSSSVNHIGLDKAIYNFNHTSFTDIAAEYKATPDLIFKTDLGIYRDRFSQYFSSTSRYFTISPVIEINQRDSITNKNTHLEWRSEVTYNIGNNFQVNYSLNLKKTNEKQRVNSLFNTELNEQDLYSKQNFSEHLLEVSYKIDSKNLLSMNGKIGNAFMPQTYSIDPFKQDTLFHYSGRFSDLMQQITSHQSSKVLQVSFMHKVSENKILTLDLGGADNNSKLNSQLYALQKSQADSMSMLGSLYGNNLSFLSRYYFLSFNYSDRITKKWDYAIGGGLTSYKLSLYNNSDSGNTVYTKWRPNLYLNSDYALNHFSSVNLNYEINTAKSNINNLTNGNILTDYNHIYLGNQDVRLTFRQTVSVFYQYVDLFKKKILIFAGVFIRSQPLLYTRNLNVSTSYIQTSLLPIARNNTSVSIFTRIEKIIPSIGSRFIFNYRYNNFRTYTSSSNITQKNKIIGNDISLQIIQDLGKYLDIELLGEYESSINKVELKPNVNIHNINWELASNFKLSKKFNWAIKMMQFNNSSNNSTSQHIYLADTYLDYQLIPNKIQLNFSLKNIFNKKQIEDIYNNSFYTNTSSFSLRRIGLISCILKF